MEKMERIKVKEKQDKGERKTEQRKEARMRKIENTAESLLYKIILIYVLLHSIPVSFIDHQLCEIQPGRSRGN